MYYKGVNRINIKFKVMDFLQCNGKYYKKTQNCENYFKNRYVINLNHREILFLYGLIL